MKKSTILEENLLVLKLSADEIIMTLSYLWFYDLFSAMKSCKYISDLVNSNSLFVWEKFTHMVNLYDGIISQSAFSINKYQLNTILGYAARFVAWPTAIDTSFLKDENHNRYFIEEVLVPNQTSTCVAYRGSRKGANRAIVANDHFPVLCGHRSKVSMIDSIRPAVSVPFCKLLSIGDQGSVPVLSCVAYFEVAIHPDDGSRSTHEFVEMDSDDDEEVEEGVLPCVSIGIARCLFELQELMPGWDYHSYGLHGDDGLLFRGRSTHGAELVKDGSAHFGAGDVVGCGVVYPPLLHFGTHGGDVDKRMGRLFFTKNGILLGAVPITDPHFFQHAWFPCVGVDTYCPVEMNFGNRGRPFAFDVAAYEHQCFGNWQRLTQNLNTRVMTASRDPSLKAFESWQDYHNFHVLQSDGELPRSVYGLYRTDTFLTSECFKDPRHSHWRGPHDLLDRLVVDDSEDSVARWDTESARGGSLFYRAALRQETLQDFEESIRLAVSSFGGDLASEDEDEGSSVSVGEVPLGFEEGNINMSDNDEEEGDQISVDSSSCSPGREGVCSSSSSEAVNPSDATDDRDISMGDESGSSQYSDWEDEDAEEAAEVALDEFLWEHHFNLSPFVEAVLDGANLDALVKASTIQDNIYGL